MYNCFILVCRDTKSYSNFLNDPSSTIELLGLELPIYSTEMILSWSDALIFINGRHYPIALLLGFLVVLVLSIRKMKWSFVGLSIIAILLPVGSSLTINQVAIPSSYAVLEWVFPPLVRCNFPDRLMLAPLLTIAVIFLLLSRTYIQSKSNNRVWVYIALAVLLCGNLTRVWGSHKPSVQAFQINRALVSLARTEPGGFVEFPFDIGNNTYVQSEFHRQPIIAGPGMMMVQPPASKRYRQNNSVLRDLDEINTRGFNPADKPTDVALLELYKDGFRHLVLYTEEIKQPVQMFERYLRTKGTAYPKHQIHVIPLPVDL